VFNYIKHLKNQNEYGTWNQIDPEMKQTFEGEDGTVGFTVFWESDNWKVGKGNQQIIAIEDEKSVTTEIIIDDWGDPMMAKMSTESVGENQTKVTWQNEGKMLYPFNTMTLFVDMEDDFEEGLENLKKVLEAQETNVKDKELENLISQYEKSNEEFKSAIKNLSETQLNFKPSDSSWSINQCADHIIKTENALAKMLQKGLTEGKKISKDSIKVSDDDLMKFITNRQQKSKAPEAIQGKNKYKNSQQAIEDFTAQRESFKKIINNYTSEQLRNQVLQSPAGYVDAYQFSLFISGHTQRHIAQIKEVKADENFPK